MIDTHGWATVKALFGRVAYSGSAGVSRAAFLGVFGMTLEEAETQWLAFLGSSGREAINFVTGALAPQEDKR